LNHRPLGYEPNRMNDSSAFQRLDGAGNDRKSLKRHKGTVIGPQSDHSFSSAVVLGGSMFRRCGTCEPSPHARPFAIRCGEALASNDRDWQSNLCRTPWAEITGDRVTIHNFRYCYDGEEAENAKASPVRRDRCGRFRRRAPSPDRRRYIRRKDQFAPTAHTSGTATVGEVLQRLAAVINSFHCFAGCGRVVFLDALEYVLQVFDSYR